MEVDSPPEITPLRPRDRIIRRLALLGVPEEFLEQFQRGLVAFVKKNKQRIPELVSAILPADEEVAEVLNEAKPGSKKQSAAVTMKNRFRESMVWLQWLMFEGEPSSALKNLSKMSVGQRGVCGAVWGQNDLAYRCRTCEHDPTCAICVPCFQNGNHKDHDYSVIYTGGGCCDCGDVTAWKREGFCSKHKGAEQIQPLPEEFADIVGPVLDCVFVSWKNKLLLAETTYRETPRASDHVTERKKVANELTFVVVEMLLDFCKYSESLLSFVSKKILSSGDLLGILVRAERFLTEAVVKKLHELLLKLLGEPIFKYEFAKVFLCYYPAVVSEAKMEFSDVSLKKYPLLSVFSVQIFTVPTLTPRLVKEMNLLPMLMGCLQDIFVSCAGDDGRLQVTKWSNLYEITVRVIEDIRFVMSHAVVPKYVTHDKQDISRSWMRLLTFVQGMNPQKRETGIHIEEENENMHLPFVLGHSIANIHSLLVDGAFSVASNRMDEDLQDMDGRDSLRHAKVGRLSPESSVCSAVGRSSSFACASKVSEDKSDALSDLLIPPSVMWLTYECLRAIENWLGVDNTSRAFLDASSPSTSNFSGSNFSALKKTLSKIRRGNIFGRLASSSEDHGKQCSSHLHSDCNMSVDFQNGKVAGQETKLMVPDEIDSANACSPAGLDDSAMEVDGAMDLDALRVLSSSDWPDITYDISSQDISVHIPLHRLLSLLLQKALRRCFGEVPDLASATSANSSSAILTDFFGNFLGGCHPYGFSAFVMEHPLRIKVFCAEVHAGIWRKNGDAALLSCEWYRSVRWSEQGLELDLFLLQCCAALAPADLYVNRIVKRFGLSSYLSLNLERSSEYEAVLVQEMLTLIIQIVKERRFCGLTKAESLKRELIHKLAIADATHSQLVKSLPRDLSKFDQLPEILDTVAAYSNPSGFNQGTYSLRWTFWKEMDLFYPRWNSRDLQAAEERYLRFRSVSALTTQLPRWTEIYPPFKGVARIATSKAVLQIIRAVLFYAIFSDKSIDSRAPDGVLLTALHLLSLALDICFQHKESGDQSCYDGDAIPILAFAGEEIYEGPHFGAGQQSLLSLLVILMRMHKKANLDSCLEAGSDLSSLIGSLLKKFAEIDSGCMTKLQLLAPEVIGHVLQSSPNGDTYTLGSISDSEKRKAKARERQAAILEKMRAEQSKFMASVNSTVDDGSKSEQEVCNPDVEDDSEESAEVVCSLCHDPNSRNPISYLVLLQKSRLLNFMDRGPLSWEQPRWIDKEHMSIIKSEVTDQSETSSSSGGSGVVPSYPLKQLVQDAITEFACHGQPRDVEALLDFFKGRFHELKNIQVPRELNDESEKTLCTFETMEDAMYLSIQKELHDKMQHSKLTEDKGFSTPEGDQEKTEHAEFMLLGKYTAALSRETTENPSSSESPNERLPIDSSRLSAYDGFGPIDCDGIYLSSCGHAVHQGCLDRYLSSLKERYLRRIVFEGGHIVDPDKGEFLCPVCRRLANSVLPALPGLFEKVSKESLHSGVSSSHATGPLVKSGGEINSLQLQQGLALVQSAAKASGKVGNLKGFPLQRCGRMTSNLEISRLLCKMYFPTKQDKLSGSARVSHPMLMWDTIKYSLLSIEIAARSGGKYATPSYDLNALYKELESSSRFVLSLLLKVVQSKSKNSLHVLQRFIGIQSFAESICFGVSIDHGSETCGQGAMLRILEHVDMAVSYPDIQFWNRASDPVLARDPFSSLMWVLFCLPYRFLSCEDSLLSLVHLFYVVSVVQGIIAYLGKNQCDMSKLGVDDCLITDVSKLMGESGCLQQYFVSNYVGSSCNSNIKNIVRSLSFPYLRRCALLLNLLNYNAQAPFFERYNVLDRSHAIGDMVDTTYVALVELNEVQEIERMFKIPTLDVILKDKVVRSVVQKWFRHFCKVPALRRQVFTFESVHSAPPSPSNPTPIARKRGRQIKPKRRRQPYDHRPNMLQNKSFVKRTRGGKITKVVREHYLRHDIYCGAPICKVCDTSQARLSPTPSTILIFDTNVVLNQIDLLENPAIDDVVVLSIVLEEVKNRNLSVYNRVRALCSNSLRKFFVFSNEHHKDTYVTEMSGESKNDRNDRAIRVAAQWYQTHLAGSAQILLITNDKENKRKAIEEGISAETVESYVRSLSRPDLLDLLVQPASEDVNMEEVEDLRPSKRKIIYTEHKPMSEITSGLHRGIYHQGKLRVNRYNPFEAYVGSESIGDEIIIYGRTNMNRAFDGDIVAVELLPQDQWHEEKSLALADEEDEEEDVHLVPGSADDAPRTTAQPPGSAGVTETISSRPSGRVVGIIKRNWHSYCGSLEPMAMPAGSGGVAHALFASKDRRIPKIRIHTRQLENLLDKRIVVAVDSWDRLSRYPSGHYVRTIGQIGDRDTETEVVLIENDINTRPFSSQVLACLPPLPWSVSSEDLANSIRQDLRQLRVFSVDPPGCKDIDDALHCTSLPNGNYEVGVHIADVTNFVHLDTPLDDEASQRGTSVYLVERRIDMLPKPLTEDVCSLRADVERLAFSVIWEMTPEAEIISTRYTKSVIKSCAALSYIEAQARMDDSRLMDPLTTDLRNMNALAKIMRERRIQRGALTLASAEVKFQIDTETHDPLDIGMYQIREANQMVEEFMLAANVSVAEKILKHFPLCSLLRRHPTPTREMLEPLLRTAAAVGLNLDVSSSKALADSLDSAVADDPYFNKLIRILATRCMTQAVYFSSGDLSPPEYLHYGLAAPLYTHFTSPIRRYADVIVHRLLAASLGIQKLPTIFQDGTRLTSIADNLNYRHRNAQMASRASVELHTLIFFRKRPTDTEARIVRIRSNGFFVFVPKYGIEGPVYLTPRGDKGGGEWFVDEQQQKIRKMDGSMSYSVLQTVFIHLEIVEPQPNRPKLQLTLV